MEKLKGHQWFCNFNWNRLMSRQLKPPCVPVGCIGGEEEPVANKTIQEFISDLEAQEQGSPRRKQSMFEPEDWDADF